MFTLNFVCQKKKQIPLMYKKINRCVGWTERKRRTQKD